MSRYTTSAFLNWLRRCWSCLTPIGPRARRCPQCGAAQPRDV
jgi:rRNA maturation endonuclease Nob1